jgi:aspartyl-tRNA(Asn)/glutamyl-tRNA(Gln) amidotransferase subunit C
MAVSDDDVRHVAALARVGLDPARIPRLVRELNGILGHMEVLAAVDTSGVGAEVPTGDPHTPLRADEAVPAVPAVERHAFAPETRDGFFLVPRLSTHGDPE